MLKAVLAFFFLVRLLDIYIMHVSSMGVHTCSPEYLESWVTKIIWSPEVWGHAGAIKSEQVQPAGKVMQSVNKLATMPEDLNFIPRTCPELPSDLHRRSVSCVGTPMWKTKKENVIIQNKNTVKSNCVACVCNSIFFLTCPFLNWPRPLKHE